MALNGKNDIRYTARCKQCKRPLGDWALRVREDKWLCYDHRPLKQIVEKIEKAYASK